MGSCLSYFVHVLFIYHLVNNQTEKDYVKC